MERYRSTHVSRVRKRHCSKRDPPNCFEEESGTGSGTWTRFRSGVSGEDIPTIRIFSLLATATGCISIFFLPVFENTKRRSFFAKGGQIGSSTNQDSIPRCRNLIANIFPIMPLLPIPHTKTLFARKSSAQIVSGIVLGIFFSAAATSFVTTLSIKRVYLFFEKKASFR